MGHSSTMRGTARVSGKSACSIGASSHSEREIHRANVFRICIFKRTLIFGLLSSLLFSTHAFSQVAVDATTTASAGLTRAANTLNFTHTTTTTGTNLVLVVGISMNISTRTTTTITGVTFNGTALTLAGAHNDSTNARRTEIWYLINPPTGTHNGVVTANIPTGFGNGTVGTVVGITTFTGADQTTPIRSYASNDTAGTNSNDVFVNVPSAANDVVLDTIAATSTVTATLTSPAQTQQWGLASTGNNAVYGFASTRGGSPSAAMSEQLSANASWSVSGVSIQPSQAELNVTSSGSATQFPANITYTVTVQNSGPSAASTVSLTNTLATGLTLVSAVATGGGTCVGVNCSWASIAVGGSVSVTITATPGTPGGYPLSSTVSATSADFDTSNNSATTVSYSEFDACVTSTATAGGTLTGVINTYYPGTATVNAGSNSISLGVATGKGDNIAVGDLVLIIQMQDAAINSTNTAQYGNGINGSGSTSLNNAGVYEYATATSGVTATTGGTLSVTAAGPGGGLLYTYTSAAASSTQGARTFQVVRVPNFASATLSSTLTASAWNGTSGGVLALNVSGTLTLNNATVSVNGLGFRGAAGLQLNGNATGALNSDYVVTSPAAYTGAVVNGADGSKGEGIAGTPHWIELGGTAVSSGQTFTEGYPNGSMARGAPGNAGGGATDGNPAPANDQNAGGGAGANGGDGGQGGDSWNSNLSSGGIGGTAFPGSISRVVLGGGGGAGSRNNSDNDNQASSGAAGGGIVMIRAATITGTATINANGSAAYNATANDGGGGGGAGGSIIFLWGAVTGTPNVTLNANGGRGGDAWDSDNGGNQNGLNPDRHGPGGGGGGGVLLYTGAGATMTTNVNGGAAGVTLNNANVFYGATAGGSGTATAGISLASSPGPHSAAVCTDLSIAKSGSPSPVIVNTTLTYTITVTNNSTTSAATGITVTDTIPSDVTFVSTSIAGGVGGSCPAPTGGVLTCTFTSINASSSAVITVRTTAATPYTLAVNTAIVDTGTPDPNPINNTATASVPIEGPTSVRLSSFSAVANGGNVLITWRSGGELHNLGFNVYRDTGGEKVRLNPSLISGSALMMRELLEQHGGKSYGWIDRSPAPGALYWLEDVDLNGTRTMHGPVSAQIRTDVNLSRVMSRAMTVQDLARTTLAVQTPRSTLSQIRETVARPIATKNSQEIGFQLAAQPAVKIYVDHEGWYRVTQPQLIAAGLRPNVDSRSLRLFAEGVEQPMRITGPAGTFGPQSAIEFYGTAIDTPYSGQRVYWLIAGNGSGMRVPVVSGTGSAGPSEQSFVETIELKPRTTYFAALLRDDTDNFFGPLISPDTAELTFNVSSLVPGQGVVTIDLQGVTEGQQHNVTVTLNGATLGEINFSGQDEGKATFSISAGVLQDGVNTIAFTSQLGENDLSLVDRIDVSFPRGLNAESDLLKFTAQAGENITVTGFSQPPTRLLDITNRAQPLLVNFRTQSTTAGYGLSAKVSWSSPAVHTLLAIANDQIAGPVNLAFHTPSNLHSPQRGADVVVLTYPDFVSQLQPLAVLHQQQGKSVALLDVNAIYDEFNFGERTPDAIKQFLKAATANWRIKPHYLLLAGDASVDPRNYLGFGFFDFVPTKVIVTAELKTASDDWFSDFTNTGFPTIATGRIPARTPADVQTVVTKLLHYAQAPAASWANQSMLVADVDDPSTSFAQQSLVLQKLLPSTMNVTDVFAGALGSDAARQNLLASIQNGQLLVNYNGHGSVEVWGGSDLLDDATASTLNNGDRLPVFLIMNCLNGFFHDVFTESLAESLMLAPSGGAVAVWASSGLTAPDPQFQMNQALLRTLFAQPGVTLGDAVLSAKSVVADSDVRRTFVLFGDPLLQLKRGLTVSTSSGSVTVRTRLASTSH